MQNRYLFRGKRIDNGEWIVGSLIVDKHQDIETGEQIEIIGIYPSEYKDFSKRIYPSTICQCAGLKDKNGNLIWENDIIECKLGKAVVIWDKSEWRIKWLDDLGWKKDLHYWAVKDLHYWATDDGGKIKVIGNVFDNPDLLEV